MKNLKIKFIFCVLLLCFGITSVTALGQTKPKKKKSTRKPAPTKTVTTSTGDASVVSLADQYQDSSTQIIQPPPTQSLAATDPQLPEETAQRLKELQSRIRKLETAPKNDKNAYEQRQKILLTNLDILTKAEQRSESLRKQRFDLIDKENSIRNRLDQIDLDLRPESIERNVATMGSLRPEEIRDAKRKSLEGEKRNLTNLLNEVLSTRSTLELNLLNSDALVDKLRSRLEKDINDALDADQP